MSELEKTRCAYIPQRWIIMTISFFGIFSEFALRVSLPITITQMVLPSNSTAQLSNDACPSNESSEGYYKNQTNNNAVLYDWNEYVQGIMLSSCFWGQFISNLFSDAIIQRLSSKHALSLGILGSSVMNMLIPFFVKIGGAPAVIILRVMTGLCEGASYPAMNVLMAHWIPVEERSKAGAIIYSGGPLGTVFGILSSGLILHYSSYGWPVVFYFTGSIGLFALFINCTFSYSRPSEHPSLSKSEAQYLKEKLKHVDVELPATPWRYILRSKPVWALIIISGGNTWGFFTLLCDLPKYMNNVLKFSIHSNALFSSLPYICLCICSWTTALIADFMIAKKRLTIGQVRKTSGLIASLFPAIFLISASYSGCNSYLAVACFTVAISCMGGATSSFLVNALDIAPNYVGALMGLSSGSATISGILSPYVVGLLTPNQSLHEWRLVFWIVFIFYLASLTVYIIFGSGELQKWNDPDFLLKRKKNITGNIDEADFKEQEKFLPS